MPATNSEWSFDGLCEDPLRVVHQIFDKCYGENQRNWQSRVMATITSLLSPDSWHKIPLYNVTPLEKLSNSQLVRFRGLVQDMQDPEMILSLYDVKNLKTGEVKKKTGFFHDYFALGNSEEVKLDDEGLTSNLVERRTFYCISVPGENDWVKKVYEDEADSGTENGIREQGEESNKGQLDGDSSTQFPTSTPLPPRTNSGSLCDQKFLNFPLENMIGRGSRAVILKAYDDAGAQFLLNKTYEFVGILCTEELSFVEEDADGDGSNIDNFGDLQGQRSTPLSLVPKLHMLTYEKFEHTASSLRLATIDGKERVEARKELKALLRDCLVGDDLSAEFLLLHLISRVCSRTVDLPYASGSLPLNLCLGQGEHQEFVALLYRAIESLVPKSYCLELTVPNLNDLAFVPKKDYDANRLSTGLLQLGKGTNLVIDETVMSAGHLNERGLSNLQALAELVKSQKVQYDFSFHKIDFDMDIPCLILSEGKSLLQCELILPLVPAFGSLLENREARERVKARLDDEQFMSRARAVLSMAREQEDYTFDEEMRSKILEDFSQTRLPTSLEPKLSHETLSSLLGFARLGALTYGEMTLDEETWLRTRHMELERSDRVSRLFP